MIDWDSLGPANSPTPETPSTTAPVAPASPGALTAPVPQPQVSTNEYEFGKGFKPASQEQVDAMDPGQRMGRGIDQLGEWLFGRGNGSPLGGVPLLGDILGGVGNAVHAGATTTVVKPFEMAAKGLSSIPLGWLPGGADETFNTFGTWAKANNPAVYAEWQLVSAAAEAEKLTGGNLKADFNMEFAQFLDDQKYDSVLGTTPVLAMGRTGIGSLGGAMSNAIQGWLGIASNEAQRFLGEAGAFDPMWEGSKRQNRVEESAERLDAGEEVSDVERQAVEAWRSGAWSMDHAQDYIVSRGQGVTRNFFGQIAGSLLTDPLTWATLGAGSISKAGTVGKQFAEAGMDATTTYQRFATTVAKVQQSELGPAFRIARGLVDPFAVYKPSSVQRATTDIVAATSLSAWRRTYGPEATNELRALGREFDLVDEIDSAIASYSVDKGNEMIAQKAVQDLLERGLGEEMLRSTVDDAIEPLAQNAARDAETHLVDYMTSVSKNTFTDEETASLPGRAAAMFGGDIAMWTKRVEGMSLELRSSIHAASYKIAEKELEQARAMIDVANYTGDLPLRNMVLLSAESLDDISAQAIIDNITDVLKSDADEKIAMATAEWNAQAVRYPALANMGYAPGGQEQLEALVKQLDKELKSGGISRRATEVELNDGVMKPVRDVLDRWSGPPEPVALDSSGPFAGDLTIQPSKGNLGPAARDDAAYRAVQYREAAEQYRSTHNIAAAEEAERQAERLEEAVAAAKAQNEAMRVQYQKELADYNVAKAAYDEAVEAGADGTAADALRQPLDDFAAKWTDAPKNHLRMEKALIKLETDGYDTKDALDALEEYRVIERGDYDGGADGLEEYQQARQDAWDDVLARVDEIDTDSMADESAAALPEEPIPPTPWTRVEPEPGPEIVPPEPIDPGPKRLWNIGFRADEEVAWGLKRDVNTGRPIADRVPTISHVVDAVPGRQPFSDTTRNVLGQIIGKSAAEKVNKPIESIEALLNTMSDGVTGQRLVGNIQRRHERIAFDAGVPAPLAKEIFARAREVAGLNFTTIRGITPDNLWQSMHSLIPRDLVLKDGSTLNIHTVMDQLLEASEGDLRIMGNTSVLSQRARNWLRKNGDGSNWVGQMTVTMYNKLRYSQPMFLIQRITDAPYYSILYGVTPVGKGALKGGNAELDIITENLGRTGMARHFSIDMPEYATHSNFLEGVRTSMQQAGILRHKLTSIVSAPDVIIANNMTNMLHARLGEIVRGVLDNMDEYAKTADPSMQADMLAAGEGLRRSFAEWRKIYSESAGRVLDDNETALEYVKEQLNAWRRHVVNQDGTLDFSRLIAEGERATEDGIGEIGTIRPDILAQELGYPDAAALRRDVKGSLQKVNGELQLVKGEHDIPWLEEQMRTKLKAHPDKTRRAVAYFDETWDDFWTRLSLPIDEGGLDISPHYAKEAQDLIAIWARNRGMDPWEYLSGVMNANIGVKDLETAMGQLMAFLKAGKAKQPLEEWSRIFRGTLDLSAQRTLLDEFADSGAGAPQGVIKPARFTMKTPKSAPGKPARPPVASLPDVFKAEPGYVYRVETPEAMEGGMPTGLGVTTGKPTVFYEGKDDITKAIYRIKDDGSLKTGRHGEGGADRLTTKAVPPEDIEILAADGTWHPLSADPADTYFETQFPELVRKRILDGTPHPNPEVEAYIEQFSKWVQDSIGEGLAGQTRTDLRRLVEAVPTDNASTFNRSQALVVSLLKRKIEDAQTDIFRLAEMQTQRNVLERSLNHPLFGLYPSSYMWGKVLPETVKFLAKNPYSATYTIANVQRSIAIQREFDSDLDDAVGTVDRSAGAFLLDYMTPGLPWSDHEARMSPLVRGILNNKDPRQLWLSEIATVSPDRWIRAFTDAAEEIPGAVETITEPPDAVATEAPRLQDLLSDEEPVVPAGETGEGSITGPTKASALAPILADDLSRLQSILLGGEDADEEE